MRVPKILCFFLFPAVSVFGKLDFGSFSEKCGVTFDGLTQIGKMEIRLSICELASERGWDSSLFVIITYEKEFSPHVVKLLEGAHAPIIERKDDEIVILYAAGVNTTCIARFSIVSGYPEFIDNEAIVWNDQGTCRKSESFEKYFHLMQKRNNHIKTE